MRIQDIIRVLIAVVPRLVTELRKPCWKGYGIQKLEKADIRLEKAR